MKTSLFLWDNKIGIINNSIAFEPEGSKSAPKGIRIPVFSLKGWRPGPLDDGGNAKHFKGK